MLSLARLGLATAMGAAHSAAAASTIFTRDFSHKTHQATSKRFKTRGNGALVFKPSGRQHGMSRHGRSRNQDKGRSVVITRGEHGDLWKRVQGLNVDVAGGLRDRAQTPKSNSVYNFKYSSLYDASSPQGLEKQATNDAKLAGEVSAAIEAATGSTALRGFQRPTPKNKVQWRLASQ